MSRGTVGYWFCVTLLATVVVANAQSTDHIVLSLQREYGRALYTQCRLSVVAFERQGRVSLWCGPPEERVGTEVRRPARQPPDVPLQPASGSRWLAIGTIRDSHGRMRVL